MSGIFGFVDPGRSGDIHSVIRAMGAAMSHRDWFVAESFLDDVMHVGIGRIGIGIFNKGQQPIWNAARTVALVLAGEFYNKSRDRQSDEEYALALYEAEGIDFVSRLQGAFILGIYDKRSQTVFIANDRFGLYPLFYTCYGGRLIFAPEMKGILCDKRFPRKLDLTALAQYVRFQHLLGERTFFEDLQLLPAASILTYDIHTGHSSIQAYWTFDSIKCQPEITFEEAVEEAGRLFRQAVRSLSEDSYRPGVYLSGGLDSRLILGVIRRRPVVSLTYGNFNCRDVYYSRQIAQAVGSEHHWFDLPDGKWVEHHVDFHLELTEGLHSWIHAHGMSTLPQARELMDVNLTGWDGGTVMAYPESPEYMHFNAVDDMALAVDLFSKLNQTFTWPSITEAEERLLYNKPIWKEVNGLAFESFQSELARFLGYRPEVRAQFFFLRNHCARLTQNFITFTRSHIEVRFPFFNYQLFDFMFSLPVQILAYRKLYRAVVQRETPKLALIPYDHDEFLPTTQSWRRGIHAATVKIKRRINRHISPIFPQLHTLYADYENYLRNELRSWAENILFDRRTVERGLFDESFLRSLMLRHLSNQEQWTIGKIAPLITYEMMLRRFVD